MRILSLIFIALLLFISALAQSKLSDKDTEAIKQIKETYRTAWLENDEKTILSLFWDDATLYPNGLSPRKGKEAMKEFWFAPSDTVTTITGYQITVEDVFGEKNTAYVSGSSELAWTMTNKTESKKYGSNGLFLTVFVKRNKEWKIYKHIWNGRLEEIK